MRFQRRQRTTFSRHQLDALKEAFKETHYPDADYRDFLAKTTSLDPSRIQVWFQNQRAKVKKSKGPDDSGSCYSPSSFELGSSIHQHQLQQQQQEQQHNNNHHQEPEDHRRPSLFRKQSVYIFNSTIANEAALAVSEGKFASIIEFHRNKHRYSSTDAYYN